MRPIKIEFQAFGPYPGYEVVDFENLLSKGLFLICGKTGTGKTTILDAMTYALYGQSSGSGRGKFEAMRCTNADFDTTTFVRFEFENNGDIYRFERRLERKRKNLSASYNVEKKEEDGIFRPLFENAKEGLVNDKAKDIIGLEYDQFRQVIVLPQGQFEKLLTSNSDEKEKILSNIFGEDKWQKIAVKMCDDAEARKKALDGTRDKIAASLAEEQCETMSQLYFLIAQKKEEEKALEEEMKEAGLDKLIADEQTVLSLAKQFEDLDKAQAKVTSLEEKKAKRVEWEGSLNAALRAEKVRLLLHEVEESEKDLQKRQAAENAAKSAADAAITASQTAEAAFQKHLEDEPAVEEKKALKVRYEEKRTDYQGIDQCEKELQEILITKQKAESDEKTAKEKLDACVAGISSLQMTYKQLSKEHTDLLDLYVSGITGVLAEQLVDGEPCPVCGNTEHPHKAPKSDNDVTKEQVDQKKEEVDTAYQNLQAQTAKQDELRAVCDQCHDAVGKINEKLAGVKTRLDSMKAGLVEGIETLPGLEKAIKALEKEIDKYSEEKTRLEAVDKAAKHTAAEETAKLEPAKQETANAKKKAQDAEELLAAGLKDNQFASKEEAKEFLLSEKEIDDLRTEIANYDADVKTSEAALKEKKAELSGVERPDEEASRQKIKEALEKKDLFAKRQGVLTTEIVRLEKKAENLEAEGDGIEEKIRQAEEDFSFARKLRGDSGTSLQRYVLGIMFSSVIASANKMLSLVHDGRYRLFRSDEKVQGSNKRGLELKVYDRKSKESEGRFVNTLSGGEKFLTSLALSIGMSTIAQKSGIKIEALFIDEGFGSLDEDSIADAMSILNSIQEANGLVGIISHVQLLRDQIGTKLEVKEEEKGSHIVQTIG